MPVGCVRRERKKHFSVSPQSRSLCSASFQTFCLTACAYLNTQLNTDCFCRLMDYVNVVKELHWLPVAKQLEVRDILMAFKCIKGLAPPSLCNKFSTRSQVHTRNTRNKDKLHIPSFRSATGQRSFSYRAVQLWNDLPESLANIRVI